jgi:hypothetical protein
MFGSPLFPFVFYLLTYLVSNTISMEDDTTTSYYEVKLCAPEGYTVSGPLVSPVVLLLNDNNIILGDEIMCSRRVHDGRH